MMRWIVTLSFVLFAQAASAAQIIHFTPQGITNSPQQVVAYFNKAMITRGSSDANAFDVACTPAVSGYARWHNDKTWVYRIYGNVPGGSECTFSLKPNVTALGGEAVTGTKSFTFNIDGPGIKTAYPSQWQREDMAQDQSFVIWPEVPVEEASLANVRFEYTHEAAAEAQSVEAVLLPNASPRKEFVVRAFRPNASAKEIADALVFTPATKFPRKAKAKLIWPKGIKAAESGKVRQTDAELPFVVSGGFRAVVSCPKKDENSGCDPTASISIDFTNPVLLDNLDNIELMDVADNSVVFKPSFDLRDGRETFYKRITFKGPFKPNARYKLINLTRIADREGVKLENKDYFDSAEGAIVTGQIPPIVSFNADFGVLESELEDGRLPIRVRRTEKTLSWYKKQAGQEGEGTGVGASIQQITGEDFTKVVQWVGIVRRNSGSTSVYADAGAKAPAKEELKLELDDAGKVADQVQGLKLAGKGLNIVEVKSSILGAYYSEDGVPTPRYASTAVLVTDMAAHVKVAKGQSLVWVTSLKDGKPVSGAKVTIADCKANKIWEGSTNGDGVAFVKNGAAQFDLAQAIENAATCGEDGGYDYSDPFSGGAFVIASKGDDFTFTHTSWNKGIETWRFGVNGYYGGYYGGEYGFGENAIAHTVLDRSLYSAGDKVEMKHFLRKRNGLEFTAFAAAELPNKVWITHSGSGDKYEVEFADFRRDSQSGLSGWEIPKTAKLGTYYVQLVRDTGNGEPATYQTASFSVEEFKLPLMNSVVKIGDGSGNFIAASELEAKVSLSYMNGGPAKNKAVSFRYYFTRHYFDMYEKYPGYSFDPNKKELGEFDSESSYTGEEIPSGTIESEFSLDETGGALVKMEGLPSVSAPFDIRAELQYFDPSGQTRTSTASATVWSRDRLIGIKFPDGYEHANNFKFEVVVVDRRGNPVPGVAIKPEMIDEKRHATPTRVLGGVYFNEVLTEVYKVSSAKFDCGNAVSDDRGTVRCSVEAPDSVTGSVYVQVSAQDSAGREVYGKANTYVGGYSEYLAEEVQNRMDLYTDKEVYNPELNKSDKVAKVEVGMPFTEATALVTVEADGVLEAKVVELKGDKPVVNVNVDRKYAPGVYVSVMAVRGRVSVPTKTGEIDRGKPAFRMGLKKLNVASASNSLDINVSADKGADYVFEAGEKVEMTAEVKLPGGEAVQNGELAIAIVDEALLSMVANPTWDILPKMLSENTLKVNTSTVSTYLIGARHFGSKSVAHGGGGAASRMAGQMPTRDNFVPLVDFIERVQVKNGKAKFSFTTNDSLSTFRVVAIGQKDLDRFGMGYTTYRTNKDVILNNGLTKSIRTGDRFKGEFQVRNTTDSDEVVTVTGQVIYTMEDGTEVPVELGKQILEVEANGATTFAFDGLQLQKGAVKARYEIFAMNGNGKGDKVRFTQRISETVTPAVQSLDFGAVGKGGDDFKGVRVALAETAMPNVGGVNVKLSANPLGDMQTVAKAMRNYPYLKSFGFKLAQAVVENDEDAWNATMAEAPLYITDENMLKPYAKVNYSDANLTVFALEVAAAKKWSIPEETEAKLVTGLKNYVISGFNGDAAHVSPERTLRDRIAAMDAIAGSKAYEIVPDYVLPQEALDLIPAELSLDSAGKTPTTTLVKWYELIVKAGNRMPNAAAVKEQILAELQTRVVANGREVEFREGPNARGNASYYDYGSQQATGAIAYLNNVELQTAFPQAKAEGVMVGLLGEQSAGGVWYGYQANAWGAVATEAYKAQSGGAVSGKTVVAFGEMGVDTFWSELTEGEANFSISWADAQAVEGDVVVEHNGEGKPWAFVTTVAAVPVLENRFNGIVIDKKIEAVEQAVPGKWSRTDIAKVTLTISPDTDQSDVAIYDPIPAGARILNQSVGWYGYYSEARADAYVANLPYVSREGRTVTYLIEFTSIGDFSVPGTRAEAVFAPEIYGEWANKRVSISDL